MNPFKSVLLPILLLFGAAMFAAGLAVGRWSCSFGLQEAEPEPPPATVVEAEMPPSTVDAMPPVVTNGGGEAVADPGVSEKRLETEEGRWVALALADENELLRTQVLDLKGQVEQLLRSAAAERFDADRFRAERELVRGGIAVPARAVTRAALDVVEVDREHGLVALRGGSGDGVRPGLRVTLLRGDAVVARARVVAVRERMCAATVEARGRDFPARGDRAIPADAPAR